MKLVLCSDLHLEFMESPWRPPALDVDVVILAGDISLHTRGVEWAAKTFRDGPNPPPVLYVAGNHEYYGADLADLTREMCQVAARLGVTFLENEVFEYQGVRFLGTTLWSDFGLYGPEVAQRSREEAEAIISDYAMIRSSGRLIAPADTIARHEQAAAWLTQEIAKPFDGKTVVVTHFAPHRGCVPPQYAGDVLTPYFHADMSSLMARHPIALWAFGHTHHNVDFEAEGRCRVVSNQRGYPDEAALGDNGFRAGWVIEL